MINLVVDNQGVCIMWKLSLFSFNCGAVSFSFLFPLLGDVSVYQVGLPVDREQYIHRLGRTGREGKEGEGILLLAPWEQYFLDDIKDLPMENWPVPRLDPRVKVKVSCFVHTHSCFYALIGHRTQNAPPIHFRKLKEIH